MKPSLLIVDDEKVICNGLSRLFANDFKTYKAYNAMEALEIVRENGDIDIMLCDIKLPGIQGDELVDRIRTDNKDLYIIVITAAASPLKVCSAMKKGANLYIRKPFNISQLEATVHSAVKSKKYSFN
jgi:CheY-like chemotaxis protein